MAGISITKVIYLISICWPLLLGPALWNAAVRRSQLLSSSKTQSSDLFNIEVLQIHLKLTLALSFPSFQCFLESHFLK